jgi:ABC-type transporter Mla subunit MlaD
VCQVGKVTAISFDPKVPGNVLVRISVDTNAPVTQATFATLGYQGVTESRTSSSTMAGRQDTAGVP